MSHPDPREPTLVEPDAPAPTVEPTRVPTSGDGVVVRVDEARRRSLRRWAIGAGAVLSVAVLGMSLTATPLFHAKTIRVEGAHRLSDRQVRRAAGVDAQTNVFSLDEAAVVRRLERNPWIADADVTTSLPSTVQIRVSERIPVGLTRTEDGVFLVAGDGSILGSSTARTLPEIRMPDPAVGQPATVVPAPLLVTAATAAAEFGPTLRPQIGSIVVQSDGSLTLELRNGVPVAYGGVSDLEAKAEALRAILDYAESKDKDLISIDLRSPAAPSARFVGVPVTRQLPPGEPEREHHAGGSGDGSSPQPPGVTPSP
jgi:cell division protein FtsQ